MDAHELDCGFPEEPCHCFDGRMGSWPVPAAQPPSPQPYCFECERHVPDHHPTCPNSHSMATPAATPPQPRIKVRRKPLLADIVADAVSDKDGYWHLVFQDGSTRSMTAEYFEAHYEPVAPAVEARPAQDVAKTIQDFILNWTSEHSFTLVSQAPSINEIKAALANSEPVEARPATPTSRSSDTLYVVEHKRNGQWRVHLGMSICMTRSFLQHIIIPELAKEFPDQEWRIAEYAPVAAREAGGCGHICDDCAYKEAPPQEFSAAQHDLHSHYIKGCAGCEKTRAALAGETAPQKCERLINGQTCNQRAELVNCSFCDTQAKEGDKFKTAPAGETRQEAYQWRTQNIEKFMVYEPLTETDEPDIDAMLTAYGNHCVEAAESRIAQLERERDNWKRIAEDLDSCRLPAPISLDPALRRRAEAAEAALTRALEVIEPFAKSYKEDHRRASGDYKAAAQFYQANKPKGSL